MKEISVKKPKNVKVMLWMPQSLKEDLEDMAPEDISVQEFIRQVLAYIVEKKPRIRVR